MESSRPRLNDRDPSLASDRTPLTGFERTVFVIVSLANLIPIWAFRYFPGQDTPNHLYAAEVLRLLLGGAAPVVPSALVQTFVPLLSFKTNVAFFALMLGLGHLGASVALAHRLVLSAYAL